MLHTELLSSRERKMAGEIILPDYGGFCLSEIPRLVEMLFGERGESNHQLTSWARRFINPNPQVVILFLFDGFGFHHWGYPLHRFEFLEKISERGEVVPIHSVFPSTTAASLTSIHTGLTPAEHGLLEWHAFIPSIDMVIKTLAFSPVDGRGIDSLIEYGVSPSILFRGETVYERLFRSGVNSYALIANRYIQSAYSSMAYKGANLIGYEHASDMAVNLRQALESVSRPVYFYVYWDGVDAVSHKYGPDSEQCVAEINSLTHILETEFFQHVKKSIVKDTVCLITADHGFKAADTKKTFYLNELGLVVDNFQVGRRGYPILPWGGPRVVFLQAKEGELETTKDFLSQALGDTAIVIYSEDALRNGLFGKGEMHPEIKARAGNIMILPRMNCTVWYQYPNTKKLKKRGVHGGISPQEMTVPFFIANLSLLCE